MKSSITKSIVILLLGTYTTVLSQSDFTPFKDPKKQLEFERKRIYINEEKGSVPLTFGGGSKTELANPLYPITGRDPQYVSKQSPIFTSVKYYHNFSMERNGVQISELDLLYLLGLEEERNEIINTHRQRLSDYERKYDEYKKGDKYYIEEEEKNRSFFDFLTGGNGEYCLFPISVLGVMGLLDLLLEGSSTILKNTGILALEFVVIDQIRIPYTKRTRHKIYPPTKPELRQTLSNNQIKGLVNNYNRNLYNQISKK